MPPLIRGRPLHRSYRILVYKIIDGPDWLILITSDLDLTELPICLADSLVIRDRETLLGSFVVA